MASGRVSFEAYRGKPPENYERYFVPAIGGPFGAALVEAADLRAGERVLDVACGTGIVARYAAERVGRDGSVAGLDMNPAMLAVARSAAPPEAPIEWHEAPAERMPLADGAFDVVLCSLGLQFFQDREAGLAEMHRVLAPGGRLAAGLVGPLPPPLELLQELLKRHADPQMAGFLGQIFSLHDPEEIRALVAGAGFRDVSVSKAPLTLTLPAPEEFLWQFLVSTPLAGGLEHLDEETLAAIEQGVVEGWKGLVQDGGLMLRPNLVSVTATKG